MKKLFTIAVVLIILIACNNSKKEKNIPKDTKIMLRSDTINVVNMTDTMIIYESVCRGCAFENSTEFMIFDSLGIIRLADILTKDNNAANVEGGSISKTLILVPQKKGSTTFTLIRILGPHNIVADSTHIGSYTVEVK
jgi:hypothetical protein